MARHLPTFLRDDEPERLLRATRRERDRLLLLVGLYCGLRVSELVGLRVEDFNSRGRSLFIHEGKGKKDRVIPVPRFLVGPLRGWVGPRQEGYLFPSPQTGGRLSPRAVQYLFKRLAVLAGLDRPLMPRRVTPHKLRHSYATRLLQTGADVREVQDLLGHARLSSTMVYLHTDPSRLRDAVDRLCE